MMVSDVGRRTRGSASRTTPNIRNHHRSHVVQVDPVVSRLASADEPVEQRGALGITHETFFAHARILLAGRPYGARHAQRGRSRKAPNVEYLRRLRHKRPGDSRY